MTFKLTWTRPDGSREGFEAKSVEEAVQKILKRRLHQETPGLRIKDGGGVTLKWNDLFSLAAEGGQP